MANPEALAEARRQLLHAFGRQPSLIPAVERALGATSSSPSSDRALDNALSDLFADSTQLAALEQARGRLSREPSTREAEWALGEKGAREDAVTAAVSLEYLCDHRFRVAGVEALKVSCEIFESAAEGLADLGTNAAATIGSALTRLQDMTTSTVETLTRAYPVGLRDFVAETSASSPGQAPAPSELSEIVERNRAAAKVLLEALVERNKAVPGQRLRLDWFAGAVGSAQFQVDRMLDRLGTERNPGAVDTLTRYLLPDLARTIRRAISQQTFPAVSAPVSTVRRAMQVPERGGAEPTEPTPAPPRLSDAGLAVKPPQLPGRSA